MSADRTIHLPGVSCYEQAASELAARGLTVRDVVHVAEFAATGAVARDREAFLDGHEVPVSRIPIEAAADGGASAVTLTAVPGGGVPHRVGDDVVRVAGGTVYLPSVWTTEVAGDEPGEAFRGQYRACLERVAQLLGAVGLGLEALVQTTDYTATATRAEYPRCGRPRRELLGATGADGAPVFPGSAGILVDRPVAAGAMVALDALGAIGPLTTVNPGWARYDTLTYRPAVRAGSTLHLSGFGALDPVTQQALFLGDLPAQAEYLYSSIEQTLRAAGGTGRDVVKLVEYVTPEGQPAYPGLAELRRDRFPHAAVTSVVCSALLRPEFLLETVPTAVLP